MWNRRGFSKYLSAAAEREVKSVLLRFVSPLPLCAQRGYGGRWLTPLRHYDSRPLRAANRAVSSKSGRLIRRWRRLSRFPPCFRWGSKGKVSMRQRYFPLALYGNTPLREQEKNAPIPIPLGRERKASWCHPNSGQTAPFGLLLREGNRGRFRPRSAAVLPPVPAGFSQREIPLCQPVLRCTAAASSRSDYHSRFPAVCQAIGRLLAGLTIMRQSRSPRARPRISISAVAMLLAKGTLLWSHRREM